MPKSSVVLVLTLCFALGGCTPAGPTDSLPAPSVSAAAARSVPVKPLYCKESVRDFGEITSDTVEHTFVLQNPNARPVTIRAVGKSCGCTEITVSNKVVSPGGTTSLKIRRRNNPAVMGEPMKFRELFAVHIEETDERTELMIEGCYLPEFYFTKLSVPIQPPAKVGDAFQGTFDLMVNPKRKLEVKAVRVVHQVGATKFEAAMPTIHPSTSGQFSRYEFPVRGVLASTQYPQEAVLEIETTAQERPILRLPVLLVEPMTEKLTVTPERFAFGIIKPGQVPLPRTVTIQLPGADNLKLERWEATLAGAKITHQEVGPGRKLLRVTAELPASIEPGSLEGVARLVVAARDKSFEVVVPISGYVDGR